ncbi:SPOR domain-containing protein [Azonexus sp.]|uniref:SPOR domain-containing protein n=1 Tax=Azonexus sp. TaxID=1872668 RepID=UPI0027BB0D27|nr:SPOR domain-containing protein [Azonexus sp.]
MTRDMKPPRKPQPAKKKSGGGTLVGMFIGLVLGVCMAAGVVWYINKAPLPFNSTVQNNEARPAAPAQPAQPLPLPGKPGDPMPEKRFQFYDILPGKADALPEKKETPPADATNKTSAQNKETGKESGKEPVKEAPKENAKESKAPLFLQAGSFSTPQDGDNQRAKLAFMGIESTVQQVMIEDRTLYRVRIGPYYKVEELNKIRAELAKSGIEAQLSK